MTLARELADTAGRPQGDKNLLINGQMAIFQRSTNATGKTSSGYYAADRWNLDVVNSFGTGAGTYTIARSTDVPSAQGFAYSTKIDCTTVGDQVGGPGTNSNLVTFGQYIEGQNVQHLLKGTSSAKALTLSFWVKSNRASTFVVQFKDPTNNRNISKSYTINTANTWEKKTILIPGDVTGTIDNDNTSGFTVEFWLFAGLAYITGGSLATSWGANATDTYAVGAQSLVSTDDEWLITGVQLEVGEAATDFQFEPYETVLRKCQRYYETGAFMGIFSEGNNTYGWVHYKVTKRAAPTVTTTTPTGTTTNQANYYSTSTSDRVAIGLNMINDAGPQVVNASGSGNSANTFTDVDYRSMFYHGQVTYTPTSNNDATYYGRYYANSEL